MKYFLSAMFDDIIETVIDDSLMFEMPLIGLLLLAIALTIIFIATLSLHGSLPPNRIAGTRFGWTLADEDVWYSTQRRGARPLLVVGVLLAISSCIRAGIGFITIIFIILPIILISVIDQYLFARRSYLAKHGTTRVERIGFGKFRPPLNKVLS